MNSSYHTMKVIPVGIGGKPSSLSHSGLLLATWTTPFTLFDVVNLADSKGSGIRGDAPS